MRKVTTRGFSLIELLVVIAILGVILSLTFANAHFLNRSILRLELNKLYATAMYAQRVAMVTNKKQTITFDQANRTYAFNGRKEVLPPGIDFGFLIGSQGPPSAPNTTITTPITFKNKQIVFSPNGIMQSGTVYLIDKGQRAMYALSSPVSQVSFLRKYRYEKKWIMLG